MRAHPTTSGPASGRRLQGPLSELYHLWRLRPRLESPHLFWALLGVAVLFDAAAAALAVCLLFFPAAAASAESPLGRCAPVSGGALLAVALLFAGRLTRTRPGPTWRGFYGMGLIVCATMVGLCAARVVQARGISSWGGAVACLAAAAALVLEASYRHGILASCGAAVLSLGWIVASRLPLSWDVGELRATLLADGWQAIRDLVLLAGAGALVLAWAAANLTLSLIFLAPHRRSTIRTLADAAYRALALAVCLLAACILTEGLPLRSALDVGMLLALAAFALLLHARFADWIGDLGLALGCALGVATATFLAALLGTRTLGSTDPALLGWLACAVVANTSLAAHAAHRWFFTSP